METIFGIKWKIADYVEVLLIVVPIILLAAFYALIRYYQYLNNKKNQARQLFLFKLKQLGLSNFQTKVLYSIINTLALADPNRILESPEMFESAIGDFLKFLKNKGEKRESISAICKDMIITYERLYHPAVFKDPMESIAELEPGQLLYISINASKTVFIGKLLENDSDSITLKLFRHDQEIGIPENADITVYLWRAGDAEYNFNSTITEVGFDRVVIKTAREFNRGKEVRRPYVDVVIPCVVKEHEEVEQENKKKKKPEITGVIYKLHEDELIIRTASKMDYRKKYELFFTISDFKMKIIAIVIADRTLQEENVFYFTFRYIEISDAAKNLLKKYITDRI